jgi:hypothetical protein
MADPGRSSPMDEFDRDDFDDPYMAGPDDEEEDEADE